MNIIKTNKEIIQEISKIVEPYVKFNMDDIYGDRGGIPYPQIEELDILHFKFDGKNHRVIPSKNFLKELVNKINGLNISQISKVEIVKYNYMGLFIVIQLDKYNERMITIYNDYLDYKNTNAETINNIYQYLGEKIPEEFVGWVLFNKK
jgi:hypothetical protein